LLGLPEGAAGMLQERPPRIRQLDVALVSVKQRRSHFSFQVIDLLRDGRLGHVQSASGTSEVKLLGHGDEVPELA
jgi:hypothetical protein